MKQKNKLNKKKDYNYIISIRNLVNCKHQKLIEKINRNIVYR